MKIIGFNYTKIAAERLKPVIKSNISTNIQITEAKKEESEFFKNTEVAVLTFVYELNYNTQEKKEEKLGEIKFEGRVLLSLSQEESKELWKSWKKKEVSTPLRLPVFNFILKKCTAKSLPFQDELGLPFHIPMPRLSAQSQ